ncbi:MAG TPA: DUF2066 domain-containing protein [Steroidobacteraceae bacterium]|nr:DUF2066 domain-containing protein [Steroidobacteraceae bacterium]
MSARPDPRRPRWPLSWLAVLALATTGLPAAAEPLGDLYSVTVPWRGDNDAAFREAMRDVLTRVTGRADAAQLPNLAPLVEQASSYVTSFRRAAGNQLTVSFDGQAIENAVDASGLAFWGNERPVTLVWLALDRGGGRRALVSSNDTSAEKALVDASAARRGLPVVWPDAGDDLVRAVQQAWSGNHDALVDAARRYGADGVLIGRARQTEAGSYDVDWSFKAGEVSGGATGDLEAGPGLAAERYAGVYASHGAAQRTEQSVTVTGIASVEAYATAMRALAKLAPVRGIFVDEVSADAVSFRVNVRGDPATLAEAISRDGRLLPVDAGRLLYALSP